MTIAWDCTALGRFVGRRDNKVVARIVQEDATYWHWATYRNGWTHDHGRADRFDDAKRAAEAAQ
jgi:hypothetical protein